MKSLMSSAENESSSDSPACQKCCKIELLQYKLKKVPAIPSGPKTRDTAQGYLKYVPPHIGDPVVRTEGRTVT